MVDTPKRVLFLGPSDSPVRTFLMECGEVVSHTDEALDVASLGSPDFLVSHGYRHLVRAPVLDAFARRALNLHISLLPYNRGADPNFWSVVDNTPKGVTIHLIDEGLDTGEIVAQEEVTFDPGMTLRESYDVLQSALLDLFRRTWDSIREGEFETQPQRGAGTSHRAAEFAALRERLPLGWDTPISQVGEAVR